MLRPPTSDDPLGGRRARDRSLPGSRDESTFEDRRKEIIAAAIAVFSEWGYVGGTTTEIARRTGMTQPALYHYLGSKQAILEFILTSISDRFRAGMETVLSTDGLSSYERLRLFIRVHCSIVLGEQAAYSVYISELQHLPPDVREACRQQERQYAKELMVMVEAAIADGVLRRVDPWIASQTLLATVSWPHRWFRGQTDPELISETITSLLLTPPASS